VSQRRAILIVDDEAVLLMAIRQELRLALGADYLYETALNAENGLTALASIEARGADVVLVISDWLMPGMRGDEFLRIIHAGHPSTKLILLSGHAEPVQMSSLAQELGLSASLSKPYQKNALTEAAKNALA
jgi:DNA-binding NarL/FixJ family response regulator